MNWKISGVKNILVIFWRIQKGKFQTWIWMNYMCLGSEKPQKIWRYHTEGETWLFCWINLQKAVLWSHWFWYCIIGWILYKHRYPQVSVILWYSVKRIKSTSWFFENHGEYSESLMSEITLYRRNYEGKTIEEHRNNFIYMNQSVRKMFPQVESLLRLLLISPASSCETEWSFSALRRMTTWLRL